MSTHKVRFSEETDFSSLWIEKKCLIWSYVLLINFLQKNMAKSVLHCTISQVLRIQP